MRQSKNEILYEHGVLLILANPDLEPLVVDWSKIIALMQPSSTVGRRNHHLHSLLNDYTFLIVQFMPILA